MVAERRQALEAEKAAKALELKQRAEIARQRVLEQVIHMVCLAVQPLVHVRAPVQEDVVGANGSEWWRSVASMPPLPTSLHGSARGEGDGEACLYACMYVYGWLLLMLQFGQPAMHEAASGDRWPDVCGRSSGTGRRRRSWKRS